jgi:hypothetical protein
MVSCERKDPRDGKSKENEHREVIKIRVVLARPLEVQPCQYINLWMPTVSLWSWLQSHPFMVTSWSPGKQEVLGLFVEARRGFTENLRRRTALTGSASFCAFIGGPHGISKTVNQYETVLAVASGFGIGGLIPHVKNPLHGYNTSTSRVRWVHLVWQFHTLGKSIVHTLRMKLKGPDLAIAAQPLLNSLLTDDALDNGYVCLVCGFSDSKANGKQILEIYFYVESTMTSKKTFGEHNRAVVYNGTPDYEKIMSAEASGDYVARIPNSEEERGKMLVLGKSLFPHRVYHAEALVSVSNKPRDDLRKIVRSYLDQKVTMCEVEFQPD